jgi:hypothetical protein
LFTIWTRCTNSWWTTSFQSKTTTRSTLIFNFFWSRRPCPDPLR